MKFILKQHDAIRPLFEKGGKLELFYPLWEAHDTITFTPGEVTKTASHVRDGLDLKRMMITVVIGLIPCMLMAMYNTGLQAHIAIEAGAMPLDNWRTAIFQSLGFEFTNTFLANFVHGALYYIPVYIVTLAAGGILEVVFAIVRKHEVNEGFLVTSALLPLTCPATIPLWQVAIAIVFGVVVAKEIYGGTGMNFLNPALTARAFLFFAYPAQISGDKVWVAANWSADGASGATADAMSSATMLAQAANPGAYIDGATSGLAAVQANTTFMDAFLGFIPGSMGETSALACIFGAIVLIATGVGSWKTMAGGILGSAIMAMTLNVLGAGMNPFFDVPFWWHWVLGGFAFAIVFMATDPVSSALTERGKFIYGFSIGMFGIVVRVLNPAYPEGWMLAILFMNCFAPLIDYFILQSNVKRRMARYAA